MLVSVFPKQHFYTKDAHWTILVPLASEKVKSITMEGLETLSEDKGYSGTYYVSLVSW